MAESLGRGNLKSFADLTQLTGSTYANGFGINPPSRELLQRSCIRSNLLPLLQELWPYWSAHWSPAFISQAGKENNCVQS